MNYQEALAFLYSRANFERTGIFARDAEGNLRRMRALLAQLGDPHLAYPTTHIAGTKGKGSTAVLIASALIASGIRTGLYTQPDLHTFRERIQIDGIPIDEAEVAESVPILQAALERLDPADAQQIITYELGTALAFLAFKRHDVQNAVIEVGLGGRLDATNVILPLVSVITSISLDHTAILGDTIAAIAAEKAGIIKTGVPVVTSAQHPDALRVIATTCAERDARLIRVGPVGSESDYTYEPLRHGEQRIADRDDLVPPPFAIHTLADDREIQIALLGDHQRQNAAAALAALDVLRERGVPVTDDGIQEGFRRARWPARLDVVGSRPWLVVDGAHNADSLAHLMTALADLFVCARLHIVIGTLRDKDAAGMAQAIPAHRDQLGTIVATQGTSPRALSADQLATHFTNSPNVMTQPGVGEAIALALQHAAPEDLVCVTGSLHLAGEALRWIKAHSDDPLALRIVVTGDDHSEE
ncbi:MAG TPA: folylpolyglutamate synthase/dihydrofolate synthase family protein [Ktedonobacterales bacterium]|nr:folylpolyglutamate synthase/dihydrofolate synthase family protein [Ktedonobacterales bacterium]